MWRLIGLFSLLFCFVFGQPLQESISLRVKVVGKIVEEKPKKLPTNSLELEEVFIAKDLSPQLLEPPKDLETPKIKPLKEGKACGEPKDRRYFRTAVDSYLKGDLKKAESLLLDVISLQTSPFIPQAEYLLGVVYFRMGKREEALELFQSSCFAQHPYRDPACEASYALEFKIKGTPVKAESPDLWKKVYLIKVKGKLQEPDCSDTVFKDYCSYVSSFVKGEEHEDYPESTKLRRAIALFFKGDYEGALEILKGLRTKVPRYKEILSYYMGLIYVKKGNLEEAYRYALLLELTEKDLAKDIFLSMASRDPLFSRIAYKHAPKDFILRNLGVMLYNQGRYEEAYREFIRAKEYFLAALSAIKMGDYRKALSALSKLKPSRREHYLWLLETLYWLGKDAQMERVLGEIKEKYPELYREYMGWLLFKRERWEEAYKFFKDPYHKALTMFNAGRYRKVIEILKGKKDLRSRVLKAKAAVSMGNGPLARKFLKGETPQEVYLLGMSYFIEGKYKKAMEYFEKLKEDENFRIKALLKIADSHYNLGNYEKARELYRDILILYPDTRGAHEATLALAQIELQKPSQNLKLLLPEFKRLFPKSPLIPDLEFQLANLLIKEGKIQEAANILKKLTKNPNLRTKALLKLAQIEKIPSEKEKLLKEVIREGSPKEKKLATKLLKELYLKSGEFEKLADFLSKGSYQERLEALRIYISENIKKAIDLFEQLHSQNPQDEELKKLALKLYEKTKGKKYLQIASQSYDPKLRAKALYRLGLLEKKRDKRKALEHFVEVVLSAEGVEPYYSKSILQAAEILVSMKARKDASCLLEKVNPRHLTAKERKRVKILKKKLPKCEVKG